MPNIFLPFQPWNLAYGTLRASDFVRGFSVVLVGVLLSFAPSRLSAGAITLNFEGLPDSTILTNQYAGLTFTNAIILTSGISLNEFEFPPHSGVNVVADNGGPISIAFTNPILGFSGYFTYAEQLTLVAFDLSNSRVASVQSLFSNNEALSGDAGSAPNEFLQMSFVSGVSSLTITGDPAGGSFVFDDATITTGGSAVPEPGAFILLLSGITILVALGLGRK